MVSPSLDTVRATVHRLFIACPDTTLRKEDEQKSRELVALLPRLAQVAKGAHVVDAAAGKASVGLVAAELLPIGRLTVLERDPARVAACRAAATRLAREVSVDVREADLANASMWPEAPDVVVALHACGRAADLAIEGAIRSRARRVLVVPCCYGEAVPFHAAASRLLAGMGLGEEDVLHLRMAQSLVDVERKLRLEAAGFETHLEEFVAPTVSPHNILFRGRRTGSAVRIARAQERLAALHERRAG